ncbi:MAG: Peptidase M23 family protein [Candidatus Jorgensenbacteria bacterium GW2011_GWC1_48_8]|uniref:Peptidase M23 family protein n=2 Tax=Candidatus Joergenseniibacteriota TaxID=1752739 RepID=A0A0G1YJV4_9BACT|nr:MAG: Peptidase M23 family protein [Candidatus Jorgensenbacteria bacterium GW2011_GWC1_48_8]KKW15282.1 MAG: Peptidase M23 family protein [Candidatus Jorgensenbacteria bacterium GW2011_GWB1_50_10]
MGFSKTTNLWSLFFIFSIILAGNLLDFDSQPEKNIDSRWAFGGPEEVAGELGFFVGQSGLLIAEDESLQNEAPVVFDGAAILGSSHPLSNLIPTRDGREVYKVVSGDTLSSIAARFGVSVQTIKWANLDTRSVLKVGEELTILPVSGILYSVRDGDSLESIAVRHQIDPQTIGDYNPGFQKLLDEPGATLVLPYAKPLDNAKELSKNLPSLASYFMLPARGWNWGTLHEYNAVDIADQCSKPIYASAEGLVAEESSNGFWNQGYGNYIMIEHPNGTKTRYAHTDKNLVKVGDYVSQGDPIATIGNTGNTHGPTGCHLHFEVYGARNPFAVR